MNEIEKPDYYSEQLNQWLDGISIHNRKTDECVPDFSCCEESINTPKSVKKAFIEAFNLNDDSHIQFLYSFLGDMIKREGKNAHIVTDGLIE